MGTLGWFDVLCRLLMAAALATPVGWERGLGRHAAGLRTHILVSCGSAAFILMALRWLAGLPAEAAQNSDPFRVLQGVANGIGLVAGGAIIQARGSVHGVTTAASVWAIAAVGSACGFGAYDIAVLLTLVTLGVTSLLSRVDPKARGKSGGAVDASQDDAT